MIVAGLMVAGGLGAILRYLADQFVQRRTESDFPYGTLVINISGSLVLGFLTGAALHHHVAEAWVTVIGTGFIGAYTTFSTFTYDSFRLLRSDAPILALANMTVSLVVGLGAAAAGLVVGAML